MSTITLPLRAPSPAWPILRIAAVEGVHIARHPAFVIGLLLSVLFQLSEPSAEDWAGQSYYMVMAGWVWVWAGTLVAAACVAGRSRWLAGPDLFPGTPVTPSGRVAGTALALAAPVAFATAAVTVVALRSDRRGGFNFGDPPYNDAINLPLAQWVQIPVLVAFAGLAGIAVAHLRRARLVALLFLTAATWVCSIAIWLFADDPFRVLHPFMFPSYEGALPYGVTPEGWVSGDPPLLTPGEFNGLWREVRFDTAGLWWHLGYVAGLGLLLLWAASRWADRDSNRRSVLAAGVVLVLGCGLLQIVTAGQNV